MNNTMKNTQTLAQVIAKAEDKGREIATRFLAQIFPTTSIEQEDNEFAHHDITLWDKDRCGFEIPSLVEVKLRTARNYGFSTSYMELLKFQGIQTEKTKVGASKAYYLVINEESSSILLFPVYDCLVKFLGTKKKVLNKMTVGNFGSKDKELIELPREMAWEYKYNQLGKTWEEVQAPDTDLLRRKRIVKEWKEARNVA